MAHVSGRRRERPLTLESLEDRCLLSYAIADLGTFPGGSVSEAFGINNADPVQVVGESNVGAVGTSSHAFLWDAVNGMQDLGTLGGPTSVAAGINDAGQVVGWSQPTPTPFTESAFLWDSTNGMKDLGGLPGSSASRAFAINSLGQVVGWSGRTYLVDGRAAVWDGGTVTNLGTVNNYPSAARGINDRGQIVGATGAIGDFHALLWQHGSMQDLGGSSSFGSTAAGINQRGRVTGITYVEPVHGAFLSNPYVYTRHQGLDDIATDAGCPAGWYSLGGGAAINDHNQVVGYAGCLNIQRLQSFDYPAVWTRRQGWQYLKDLIPPDSGWTLISASGINDRGQIVGYGMNPEGNTRAFLLTPDGAHADSPSDATLRVDPGTAGVLAYSGLHGRTTAEPRTMADDLRGHQAPALAEMGETPVSLMRDTRIIDAPVSTLRARAISDQVFLIPPEDGLAWTWV
jgi:probable HAF family extracellular repeat protein